MTDIIDRLLQGHQYTGIVDPLDIEAAAEIKRLRDVAENVAGTGIDGILGGMEEASRLRDINRTLDQVVADIAEALGCKPDNEAILERIDRMRSLLRTYREKTPLGHQPHMIAQEVDMVLANEQTAQEKSK